MQNRLELASGFLTAIANKFKPLQSLYVLTSDRLFSLQSWPERIERTILGGASMIQLREKNLPDHTLLAYAQPVQEICRSYNVPLIINDRVELAQRLRADGVHLGSSDSSLRHAREYLGQHALIGISCYRNIFRAICAQNAGADYVAFGSVFASPTKKTAPRCPLFLISQAQRILNIPVCAIGGINARNVYHVVKFNPAMIAISDAVFNAHDPACAATKIKQQVIIHA